MDSLEDDVPKGTLPLGKVYSSGHSVVYFLQCQFSDAFCHPKSLVVYRLELEPEK